MRHLRLLLLAATAAALAGCGNTVLVPIAGGGQAEVTFTSHGPAKASGDGIEIDRAGFEMNPPAKAINYVFDFTVSDGRPPRSVLVEDVSTTDLLQDKPEVLAEDDHPYLTKVGSKSHWHFESTSQMASDPDVAWVLHIEDSMRMYQFTIVLADGEKLVLTQALPVSASLKVAVRQTLGLKY